MFLKWMKIWVGFGFVIVIWVCVLIWRVICMVICFLKRCWMSGIGKSDFFCNWRICDILILLWINLICVGICVLMFV